MTALSSRAFRREEPRRRKSQLKRRRLHFRPGHKQHQRSGPNCSSRQPRSSSAAASRLHAYWHWETGSTDPFATFQQDLVAATLEQAAGWVYLPKGQVLETNQPGSHSISVRRALGVVASFTPWNGANVLSWRATISPVAAGNTVIIKPSEFAPISAGLMLAEIAHEAGYPPGVINVVTHVPGAAGPIADEFFASPHVRVINLIGGVKTARMLAERAGKTLK